MRAALTSRRIPTISFTYLVGSAAIAFAICYAAVFASLVTLWSTYPLYSHGYAVPLIAGWLCWTKHSERPSIQRTPDYVLGIPLMLAGIGLLVIGRVGAVMTIQQTSLIVTLAGFVLVFFGRETLVVYRFPFAYLLFMVPIWDIGLNQLQDPSRLISAKIATEFLHLSNVPVLRHGTSLVLPSVTLSVMRQCSGVNQLVAMMAMVVPASYVFLDTNGRRLALIILSVAVGYVSNGFRIALVGWLAAHGLGNGDLSASYTHVVEGLVVSAAGYAVILAFLSALARFNKIAQRQTDHRLSIPVPSSSPVRRRRFLDLGVVGALLMAAPMPLLAGSADVGLTRDLKMFPRTVGSWRAANVDSAAATHVSGVREDLVEAYPTSTGIRRFAGVDNEVSLVYENASSGRLRLYVGYYRHQEEGRELAGETGRLLAKASAPVSLRMGSQTVTAREIVRGAEGGLLYWYDIDGRIVSNSYLVKAYTVWDGLTRQRTNGGVIMISWEGARPDGRAEAMAFAGELIPVLQTYFKP